MNRIYELLVWLIYVCIYKYDLFLRSPDLPHLRMNFPFPQLILYSICVTLYVVPFYRWIGPWLLSRRKFALLSFVTILYFVFVPKYTSFIFPSIFQHLDGQPELALFYQKELGLDTILVHTRALRISETVTDMLAFFSVMFLRWAADSERKRHELERDNLVLQLETLKAQLHPHFLFNTLNSIYGMSLTGAKDTPDFILRLSDMMRYVLYDCRDNRVDLDKDIQFLRNYMGMEKLRYPQAHIEFSSDGPFEGRVAPLLLIPFVENSFKHGAHRVVDDAYIRGWVRQDGKTLLFQLENTVMTVTSPAKTPYGGVGIENVRKRLELYYPGRYELQIHSDDRLYSVNLKIELQ